MKRVLVACEESQTVTKAFRARGFEAYSCDIQDCSGGHPEWHFKEDVFEVLKREKFDLMIAHPPCTYITNGGAVRMYPQKGVIDVNRYEKAMIAKKFFIDLLNFDCKYIAIENPLPMRVIQLPNYNQIIQPYMFGDPFSKKTCLWLKGLPNLIPTNILSDYQPFINGGGGRLNKTNYRGRVFANGSVNRSKTFQGIAEAMAQQWGDFLLND